MPVLQGELLDDADEGLDVGPELVISFGWRPVCCQWAVALCDANLPFLISSPIAYVASLLR
ncbi:hypothetical protein ACFC18_42350, partial [Streptomyces sp. NPDC056121]|uniref:hypothetical protein n=1 Tax=Streptomyces sp. NPDC056121 TaxID=3345718 RepID=UPI0035D5ADE1